MARYGPLRSRCRLELIGDRLHPLVVRSASKCLIDDKHVGKFRFPFDIHAVMRNTSSVGSINVQEPLFRFASRRVLRRV